MGLDHQTVMSFLGMESLVDLPGNPYLASELSELTETTFTVSPVVHENIPKKSSFERTPLTYQMVGNEESLKILRRYMPDWVEPPSKIFR